MTKKKVPKLLVIFDTNVLFTKVASDLVRNDVKRIVNENSNHNDLIIKWYLPEVVVGERKYQMLGKANELLPAMQKLEKLIGHSFGVGEDTLELHVDKAIANSIKECGFETATIDTNKIDWNNLISRSVMREPPFEANEKEKGFRDSIIAHSFMNLYENSPSTPNICRLALVSEDKRLLEYVEELTINSKNVRILSSLDELESLINTLVSTVPEEFVTVLSQKASKLFFTKDNDKGFYYKESIGQKIREKYSKELSDTIIPGHYRNDKTWWILNPIFMKKDRQRIYWSTTLEPEFEIYHFEREAPQPNALLGLGDISMPQSKNALLNLGASGGIVPPPPPSPGIIGGLLELGSQKKVIDLTGKDRFEIHWSTNLSQAQNLTSPKLEKIQYMGNNLVEDNS